MKSNINPYTVPENFFKETGEKMISNYRERRRRLHYGFAAIALAVVIAIPLCVNSLNNRIQNTDALASSIAQVYEYDIFLQINCL